ncbi:lysostaphin resistance A-like protein [Neobacillus sp. NPDC097160]|uniref:CPBP family intramembrane glutamic endopeptidase n=1 Tax=Neobacillus sp. NPDC097160 TaxID=3364298 RepID=UPI0037FD9863
MKLKALIGFIVLFAAYHTSEVLGNQPVLILSCFLLFFVIAHIVAKLLGENGISAFGLQRHTGSSKTLFTGYLLGLLFYGGSMVVSVITGEISFEGIFSIQQIILPLLGMILLTFLSSASEDILTRGYVFKYLPQKISMTVLVVISSVVYVLNHIWRIDDGYTQWIMLFLMGLTYAIPFAVTRSLWFTIGCHWGWNTVSLFKSQIGNMSDFKIIDHTTDWTYIITMLFFLLFVVFYSRLFLIRNVEGSRNDLFYNNQNR